MVPTFRIREADDLIGVSDDTFRRWADGGRIETTTDASGRLAVDGAELARFACELAELGDRTDGRAVVGHSVRNRFSGLVSRVLRDTVMAQVEIQAGPHRFVSLLSREAADELGLEPGVLARLPRSTGRDREVACGVLAGRRVCGRRSVLSLE